MNDRGDEAQARMGRRAALVIAATGAFWVLATLIGTRMGLSQRALAFMDMLALGGFVWALWMIYQIWRARQDNQG